MQLAGSDPRRSLSLARALVRDPRAGPRLRGTAYWAAALASLQLGELAEARRFLHEGRAVARRAGLHALGGEMAATAANLWFQAGRLDRAMAEIAKGLATAHEIDAPGALAALHGQKAYLLFRIGRYEEGCAETEAVMAQLGRLPPDEASAHLARALSNRGIARCYRGEHDESRRDLATALELHRRRGADVLAAQTLHNLGFAATQRGDVPEALSRFEEALLAYLELGLPPQQLLADRAELLTKARLLPEARQAAAEAAEAFEQAGLHSEAAEALLVLAEACLAEGDLPAAVAAGEQAAAAFARQGRHRLVSLGGDIARRAFRLTCPEGALEERLASARQSAAALQQAGRPAAALRARVEAAKCALGLGRLEEVVSLLEQEGARAGAQPPAEAAAVSHRRGLLAAARGRRRAALSALAAGMEAAFEQASELKLMSGRLGHGAELAELSDTALSLLLEGDGGPEALLEWVEWGRALANGGAGPAPKRASCEELLGSLGGSTLLELVAHRGRLLALAGRREALSRADIAPLAEVEKAAASFHLALSELVRPLGRRNRGAMAELFTRSLAELTEHLAGPLERLLAAVGGDEGPLFLVPAGSLHDLAWGLLHPFADRAVVLGPGCFLERPPRQQKREVLLVAGPDLAAGAAEVAELAALYEKAQVRLLAGPAASREAVLAALGRAEVVHLAVHGRFRADNPFLSSFALADGELSLLEMARAEPPPSPAVVVLSACDAGRVLSQASEELAGPVPGLLGFEGGQVIAAVAPVADIEMRAVSLLLHGELAAGSPPAAALLAVRRATGGGVLSEKELAEGGEEVARRLSAGALVCHGPSFPPGTSGEMLGESRA